MALPDEMFVRIDIGNDAMCTDDDVIRALRQVIQRIQDNRYLEAEETQSLCRGIMDRNGNTVGEWGFR